MGAVRVAVIGGGLAGLVAAWELARRGGRVVLLEGAPCVGGQVRTTRRGGLVVEHGAEGFTPQSSATRALCVRLGLGDRIVGQTCRRTLVRREGRLVELPDGAAARLLGIQAPPDHLGAGLLTLAGGMGELVDALGRRVTAAGELRCDTTVRGLEPRRRGWRIALDAAGDGLDVDAVVLAVPPRAAASLLAPCSPRLALGIAALEHASMLSASLSLPATIIPALPLASGVIVRDPDPALEGLRACTLAHLKFSHRAPQGRVLLRAFFRPSEPELAQGDHAWRRRALRATGALLAFDPRRAPAGAVRTWIARWPSARPLYAPDHAERIAALEREVDAFGSIALAGASYLPVGIDGAVRSGRAAAARLARPASGRPTGGRASSSATPITPMPPP
jgi:protoporphyrinogen oxidase